MDRSRGRPIQPQYGNTSFVESHVIAKDGETKDALVSVSVSVPGDSNSVPKDLVANSPTVDCDFTFIEYENQNTRCNILRIRLAITARKQRSDGTVITQAKLDPIIDLVA